jgi:putative peptidoglycan lipid II flippase
LNHLFLFRNFFFQEKPFDIVILMKERHLLSSAFELSAFSVISILLGIVSQMLIAFYYGTSRPMDAFLVSITLPTLISTYILSAVTIVVIPQYSRFKSLNQSDAFVSTLFAGLVGVCALVVLMGAFWTRPLLELIMPKLAPDVLDLAVALSPVLWIMAAIQILFGFFSSVLQANYAFTAQGLAPLAFSISVMTAMAILAPRIGIWGYVTGNVVGTAIQILFIWRPLKKIWRFNFRDLDLGYLRSFLILSWPILFGGVLIRAVPAFERAAASTLPLGTISKLSYAQRILTTVSSITLNGFITVLFPQLSELSQSLPVFRQALRAAFHMVLFFLSPMLVGLVLFSRPLMHLLLVRGAFTENDANAVAAAIALYAPYSLASGIGSVVAKGLYALQLTKLATVLDIVGMGFYMVLLFFGVRLLGKNGIPLALSIYYVTAVTVTGLVLLKKSGGLWTSLKDSEVIKLLVSLGGLIICSLGLFRFLTVVNQTIALFFSSVLGGAVYFWLAYFFKHESAHAVANFLRTKWKTGESHERQ